MRSLLHLLGTMISAFIVVGVWRESGPWTGVFALTTLGGLQIAAWLVEKAMREEE